MQNLSNHELRGRLRITWQIWVLLRALAGIPPSQGIFLSWDRLSSGSRAELGERRRYMADEFDGMLTFLFGPNHTYTEHSALTAFTDHGAAFIERCAQPGTKEPYSLGRVHSFERQFGKLVLEDSGFDTPPYGEIILQGFFGITIRYPEFHLAADICYFHQLLVAELKRIDEHRRGQSGAFYSTQSAQALARTVIITVYNLLEAVANGAAAAWTLRHPDQANHAVAALSGPGVPLWKRFVGMAEAVTGQKHWFDTRAEPLTSLFWRLKRRRDYIVHCEPDANPDGTRPEEARESQFHDISLADVEETMDKAFSAIQLVWPALYGRPRPSWLPYKADDGLYRQRSFRNPESKP